MKKDGEEPYPHKFNVTLSLEEFIEKFNTLAETQILHDEQYSVAGTFIFSINKNNNKLGLYFIFQVKIFLIAKQINNFCLHCV